MKHGVPPTWWKVFAIEYLRNGENGAAAYRVAKPHVAEKTAEAESGKLLRKPEFSCVLEAERNAILSKVNLSRDEWTSEILKVFKHNVKKVSAGEKLKAGEILGRLNGWIKDDSVTINNFNTAVLAQMEATKRLMDQGHQLPEVDVETLASATVEPD